MTDRGAPKVIDDPRPGWWAIRLTAGAPEVGARIYMHVTRVEPGEHTNLMVRSPILSAEINGRAADPFDVWARRGRPISEDFYIWLIEHRAWARAHAPHLPEARPDQRADLRKMQAVMPPRRK